jgi:branched-chain amino acid transport system permease protein
MPAQEIRGLIEEIIVSGLILGGLYALLALGFSLIRGVARIMNLAHGAFYMLTAYIIYSALSAGLGIAIAISLTLIVLISLIVYKLLIGPLREKEAEVALVTLALALVIQESVKLIWGPDYKSIPYIVSGYTSILGVRVVNQKLLALIMVLVLVSFLFLLIKRTKQGKAIRAVAQNMEVARLVGINTSQVFMISMGISGLLAGLAAVFFASLNVVSPTDWVILLQTFPVIVLGGLGSLKGSVAAAFIISFIEKIVEFTIGGGYLMQTVTFFIMLIVLFVKPTGLFGKSQSK